MPRHAIPRTSPTETDRLSHPPAGRSQRAPLPARPGTEKRLAATTRCRSPAAVCSANCRTSQPTKPSVTMSSPRSGTDRITSSSKVTSTVTLPAPVVCDVDVDNDVEPGSLPPAPPRPHPTARRRAASRRGCWQASVAGEPHAGTRRNTLTRRLRPLRARSARGRSPQWHGTRSRRPRHPPR